MSSWTTCSSSASSNYDEELAIEAKRALAYLQTKRNYRYVEFLAQGGYGWVALVHDDERSRSLAIKCSSDTSEMELSWWIKLDHPNILPLLEYITLDTCTVFIMPAMRKDLFAVVNEDRFYDEELSFGLCRNWLRDVASALAYLHEQFLCHLDLKLDNVFLKEDGFACLGDFSLISDIREVPHDCNFLEVYQPPEFTEWCHGDPPPSIACKSKLFSGDKADMWQFGILSLDLLTDMRMTDSKSSRFTLFHHDVWPFLQKVLLHPEYLNYLLEETFVNVLFQPETLKLCHEFLSGILSLEPECRMSADEARRHEFADTCWPELPKEFTLPKRVVEHLPEKPLPREELSDPTLSVEEILRIAGHSREELHSEEHKGPIDAMRRDIHKMQKEKMQRRESIAVEAGTRLLTIHPAPSHEQKPTPGSKKTTVDDKAPTVAKKMPDKAPNENEHKTVKKPDFGKKPDVIKQIAKKPEPFKQPVKKPEAFKQPIAKPGAFKQPVAKPGVFKQPIAKPETSKLPINKPEAFKQPIAKPGAFKQPIAKPGVAKGQDVKAGGISSDAEEKKKLAKKEDRK